ncbi:3',5'-cyclic adenosine monophosphate phosphodiesterase CpdA [Novosphingobium endophyticum]|uniref:3',5'-cyclic adenosine monophosphate phosphodiesterase CpdA n=1 Tax=Novosphingobium endophyticum TaxID=1955250 RepID=A0A916X3X2_9SPHN|nr:phosphodiesterase [Novosphingobium endophyticum]GGB95430.1 3',5'-cyclic adenosine monophosphate phosphodiesterase CpdA [Novosphingobium endophyticum]
MLIAQITDLHIGFSGTASGGYNTHRLRAVIERLVEGPNRPDLLIMSGDMTEFGDAPSYARLAEMVRGCPFPVAPMVGNHDAREAMLAAFPDCPTGDGFVQYALDLGPLRVLVLDTLEEGRHGGAFCKRRAAWLAGELAAHPGKPTLIAMHHPPFESGIAWLDTDEREDWIVRLAETVRGHGQIRGIVAGHLHRTIHALWEGIPVAVTGSTAATVALDLNPVDPDKPDGRAMITTELPAYALHRWDGRRLVSHVESVGALDVLARYDRGFQETVRLIDAERREG